MGSPPTRRWPTCWPRSPARCPTPGSDEQGTTRTSNAGEGPARAGPSAVMRGCGMALTLRIMTEPQQGASYDDQLAVARTAEEAGFDAYFRSDHYQAFVG